MITPNPEAIASQSLACPRSSPRAARIRLNEPAHSRSSFPLTGCRSTNTFASNGRSTEDAQDLTQGFFTAAIEKNFFGRYDPSKAKFRTFLRTCLDGYVANEHKAAGRLKRGGGASILPLDFESAERELKVSPPLASNAMDDYFDREWVRSVFGLAVETLRAEMHTAGKESHFLLFQRYVLDEPDAVDKVSYRDLAAEFNVPVTSVTNYLAGARREFRRIVLDKLRELTATDDEFRREARALLGVDPQ